MACAGLVAPPDAEQKAVRLRMLEQGAEQNISVDPKTLLARIMQALRAKPPAIVSETDCGDEGMKIAIQLEMPFAPGNNVVVLEGAPSKTRSAAEKNTLMLALKHLGENYHVIPVDFSSRVARHIASNSAYRTLAEAVTSVKSMLHIFESTLGKIKGMALQFEEKIKKERSSGQPRNNAAVYIGITAFLASLLQKFSSKASESLSKVATLEEQRIQYKLKILGKPQPPGKQRPVRKVLLSTKYVLDYLLSYFGFENASYNNGPDDSNAIEAHAMFEIPRISRLKLCGNLKIRGTGDSSESAEEDAAYQALLLMETNFNVTVVDLYHAKRVEAEQAHAGLLAMANNVLAVGEGIRVLWDQLKQEIAQHRDNCSDDTSVTSMGGKAEDQIAAYQVSMEALDSLERGSAQEAYEISWELYHRLEDLKLQLTMNNP